MNKSIMVAAVGLLALAGGALAEQAILVNGNLHTPAGDVPIDQNTGGIPIPDTGLPLGDAIAGANGALGGDEGSMEVQEQENGLRPNIRCSALSDVNQDGALDMLCTEEPTVAWVDSDYVMVGPGGVIVKQWAEVDSGQAFTFLPEEVSSQIPEEQKEALAAAHDQVNAQAAAAMVDDSQRHPNGARPRFFGGSDELLQSGKLRSLLGGLGFGIGDIGDGAEEILPDGWNQLFDENAPGFQSGTEPGANLEPASEGSLGQGGDNGLGSMALAAAVIGGAILAPMALYHRIRSNNALNNKTRQMVYDAVVRSPGLGVNDAAKAADCSYSTAAYHLERLVEERLLIVSEDGRRARYFKNGGAFTQAEREFVPILQSQECMNVLGTIVENPWCYRAEVAQKLGVSGPTVNWHLKKLMTAGVVKEMREGRVSYLYADKKVLNTLGANLVGKMPDDLVARLRFENRPATEFVEPAASLPETTVPEVGLGEYEGIELAPLPEQASA